MTVASLMGVSVASVMTVVAVAVAMSSLLMIASIEVVGVLK